MNDLRKLLAILKDKARVWLRGSGRYSVEANHRLLQDREKTRLQDGQLLSLEEEQALLADRGGHERFMGIVPLRCKLGDYKFLTINDDHIAERLFWLGCFGYERTSAALFTHLAQKANNVLDLGAYTGYYSLLAAVLAKNPRTVAVEANPLNYHRLCENIRINAAPVKACNLAVAPEAASEQSITLFYDASLPVLDTGAYAAHEAADLIPQKSAKQDSFVVTALSFRSLMDRFDLKAPQSDNSFDLIKLDVEGLEAPLLRDIIEFYQASNFLLLVEILTPKTYAAIHNQVKAGDDLALAYINEYEQTITARDSAQFGRQQGSRNFLVGREALITDLCETSPHQLLASYE